MTNKIFFIAEAGVNHNGNIKLAYQLIDKAKEAGADAVKFQTFKAENIVTDKGKMADYQKENLGVNQSQYSMLKKLELTYENFVDLKKYCDKVDIMFLSTPHSSFEDIDFLNNLGMNYFKFGSGDLNNIPFLKYAAKFDKPLILGTGMSYLEEIESAIKVIKSVGNNNITVLHATTNYPCPFNEVNLRAMLTMLDKLDVDVGYSDHTLGWEVPVLAGLYGAKIIEKHFTLDNNMTGPDHKASADIDMLKIIISKVRNIEKGLITLTNIKKELGNDYTVIMGDSKKEPNEGELKTMKVAKKSIVLNKSINKGEIISENNLSIKRPMGGLEPKYYFELIGKKVKNDFKKDYQIKLSDCE